MAEQVAHPDEQLRQWAESQGLWSESEKDTDPFVSSALRRSITTDCQPASQVSGVAGFICTVGWCSTLVFPLLFLAGFMSAWGERYSGSLILGVILSVIMAVPGLMMVGFGMIVENIARIERHLRNKR